MRLSDNIAFAINDIRRRKKRIALTSFGITLGSILIILMVSLGLLLNQFMVSTVNSGSNTKSIDVNCIKAGVDMEKDSEEIMSNTPRWLKKNFNRIGNSALDDFSEIEGVEGIKAYVETQVAEVIIEDKTYNGDFQVKGYNTDYNLFFESDINNAEAASKNVNFKPIIAGKNLEKDKLDQVLIGESLLKDLGVKNPEDIIGDDIVININNINGTPIKPVPEELQVAGVMSKDMPDGNKIVMNVEKACEIAGVLQYTDSFFDEYGYNGAVIEGESIDDLDNIAEGIRDAGYYAESPDEKTEKINSSFNDINFILSILGIIVIIVAAIGIVNTMIMAVHERKKSIGIMKAAGAGNSEIRKIFIVQSGVIGLIGSIAGSIVASIIFRIISGNISNKLIESGNSVELIKFAPWWLILATIVFSVIISVIAGLYPSKKASELDPVEALRD